MLDLLVRQAEVFREPGLDAEAREALGRAVVLFTQNWASAEVRRAGDLLAALELT